ncbi:hypothetical protein WS52_00645 [Burkholderia territorii]|nr:hypothetical protein WS52_00645 [Burkholderia territorii]KUZ51758.1 hypothetical protein WS53_19020 [Burkholderia territorii]
MWTSCAGVAADERTHERTNARTHERTNARTHERTNARTHMRFTAGRAGISVDTNQGDAK